MSDKSKTEGDSTTKAPPKVQTKVGRTKDDQQHTDPFHRPV